MFSDVVFMWFLVLRGSSSSSSSSESALNRNESKTTIRHVACCTARRRGKRDEQTFFKHSSTKAKKKKCAKNISWCHSAWLSFDASRFYFSLTLLALCLVFDLSYSNNLLYPHSIELKKKNIGTEKKSNHIPHSKPPSNGKIVENCNPQKTTIQMSDVLHILPHSQRSCALAEWGMKNSRPLQKMLNVLEMVASDGQITSKIK